MPPTTAAGLLALVGLFDVGGTIASGWFTDRVDPRYLLLTYYTLRGVGLAVLPSLLAPHTTPGTWVFVIFYGLDWVATVPPTVMLCREWFGPEVGSIVFGWVFASHQIGASAMAFGAGVIRDRTDSYDPAFYTGAVLCVVAAAALVEHPASSARTAVGRLRRTPVDQPDAEHDERGADDERGVKVLVEVERADHQRHQRHEEDHRRGPGRLAGADQREPQTPTTATCR